MKEYKFRSITTYDIPAMDGLLIERQNLESKVYPFLKNRCLNTQYITDMFEELFTDSKVIGVGAFSNDGLVGKKLLTISYKKL